MASFRSRTALPLVGAFLLLQFAFHLAGGTNPDSRLLMMAALVETGSPRIDGYERHTDDWARTPDGHYYSNKAPGPALLALPLYFLWDRGLTWGVPDRAGRDALRLRYKARILKMLSWLLQTLPFAWLLGLWAQRLEREGVGAHAVRWGIAAAAFGTTATFYFNNFHGHGFAAVCLLAFALSAESGDDFAAGAFIGLAVLSDYACLWLLPAALWGFGPWSVRKFGRAIAGALPALAIWVVYHTACFGSPFTLPAAFQNPKFVDWAGAPHQLWGVLRLPNLEILGKLLVGTERGLLWTQPWILVLLTPLALAVNPRASGYRLNRFALGGLLGLLLMNSGFNGWHGGLTPGPRYLSPLLPLWGLALARLWQSLPVRRQRVLQGGIALSLVLGALVFATHIATPVAPVWAVHGRAALIQPTPTAVLRLCLLGALAAATLMWMKRGGLPWKSSASA